MSVLSPILQMATEGAFTVRAVAESLGWSHATAHHRVYALYDMGLLDRHLYEDEHGRHFYLYTLSPLGHQFVLSGGLK